MPAAFTMPGFIWAIWFQQDDYFVGGIKMAGKYSLDKKSIEYLIFHVCEIMQLLHTFHCPEGHLVESLCGTIYEPADAAAYIKFLIQQFRQFLYKTIIFCNIIAAKILWTPPCETQFSTTKRICLVCFCDEEGLCHRSIVGGMLQGAGLEVKGLMRDYSYYYDWYKNGVPGVQTAQKDEKKLTDDRRTSGRIPVRHHL